MAQFYPFIDMDHAELPEPAPSDYRITAYLGALDEDELIHGPAMDTARLDDIHAVLMLLGVAFEALQPMSRSDGRPGCGVWLSFPPIAEIKQEIVLAVEESAAGWIGGLKLMARSDAPRRPPSRPHDWYLPTHRDDRSLPSRPGSG